MAATSFKSNVLGIPPGELERLLAFEHHDPHSILGPHRVPRGFSVRAYRPDAERMFLIVKGAPPRPMTQVDKSGLFEATIAVADGDKLDYRLRAEYAQPSVIEWIDPYAFAPTLGELDLHLLAEGTHERIYQKLGAHPRVVDGVEGVAFAVWAPNARGLSVVADFNAWDGRIHMMRALGGSGVWELFVPGVDLGVCYKFEIRGFGGGLFYKNDPYGLAGEAPPKTASMVYQSGYPFADQSWIQDRARADYLHAPISIYEVHLGSWRRVPEEGNRALSYRELAPLLADYVIALGFTHVELLPVMEHPFSGSWGYQSTGYFCPTARYGSPDDFRYLVDYLHQRGVGVILDWVPGHFPTDAFSLGRFDGTALYEHLDAREGFHSDWGTYVFNYGRNEVRTFLMASAMFWLGECHADGLRVDAVASMLYRDYGRKDGQWVPNRYGGRENLEAVSFIKELNERAYADYPGVLMVAEESTAWPAVSRPTYVGGLGFGFKWDMGWMNDTLAYFARDPVYRRYHHRNLTFGFLYAWSENFVLPLSHDEVVHGKRSLLSKMPGYRADQFANLRALYGYMWARPGKKLLFMGGEFGQWREWNHDESLDWHLLDGREHAGVQALVRDLNRLYRTEPALYEADHDPAGFSWVDADNADDNAMAFMRIGPKSGQRILCVGNFSPVVRRNYRVGVPAPGACREILNTDSALYGGNNIGNSGQVIAEPIPRHGLPYSISIVLPPLGVIWFELPNQ